MSNLTLHYHPLSSYCQKVLIALDAMGVEVNKHLLNIGDPVERAGFLALWPTGKMPLLIDRGQPVSESSIIIEHLQRHHASTSQLLIPLHPDGALKVRLWDRLCDQYVMTPMQTLTADLLRPDGERDALGTAQAHTNLASAYAWIDDHLKGRTWIASDTFSMADCAAAPALFYAITYVPIAPQHGQLQAYFDRLMDHGPVARVIEAARPYFKFYPGRGGLSRRFFEPQSVSI